MKSKKPTNLNYFQSGPLPKVRKKPLPISFKPRCPYNTGVRYCTHIANQDLTNRRKNCIYYKDFSKCPHLNQMKEDLDGISDTA